MKESQHKGNPIVNNPKVVTYTKEKRNSAAILDAGQENLLAGRALILGTAEVHTLEERAVEHHAKSTIGAHDHSGGKLSGVGAALAGVELEGTDAALFPFARVVEQLALAGEHSVFFLLTGFDWIPPRQRRVSQMKMNTYWSVQRNAGRLSRPQRC